MTPLDQQSTTSTQTSGAPGYSLDSLVLDTNIVLDLFVFDDAQVRVLKQRITDRQSTWYATESMREELLRVLDYPQIRPRMAYYQHTVTSILELFDQYSTTIAAPEIAAPYKCKDTDDQKFIDLAWQHQAVILSKDKAVLKMHKRLKRNGAAACTPQQFTKALEVTP